MRQNIYDNESFAMQYDKMRKEQKGYNANDLIEIPNFRNLIPNVKGKRVLDLGCGYGENSRYCIENGALYVLGIDISKHMLDIANKENLVNGIEYVNMAMEDISQIDKKFDIVISSLAFHYIKDFKKLMKDIYNLLDENGTLVFSIDHPLRIASIFEPWMEKNYIELNGKWFLLVSDYSRNGLREKKWNGEIVKKYHRNFSELINNITDSGLKIDKLLEPLPTEEMIQKVPKYIHQIDRPFFLFVKAVK
jgi:SAM-dependent methyltransferase